MCGGAHSLPQYENIFKGNYFGMENNRCPMKDEKKPAQWPASSWQERRTYSSRSQVCVRPNMGTPLNARMLIFLPPSLRLILLL